MAERMVSKRAAESPGDCCLEPPRRNRYFYGKLLDADHFQLETDYHNAKRWLVNRLVAGYGVVCGLGVNAAADGTAIVIQPGVAIDKHGREIVVPEPTPPIAVPEHFKKPPGDEDEEEEDRTIHVVLCHHECPVEPAPVMAGGCHEPEPCEAGVILERYKVMFRAGCVRKSGARLRIPDVITGTDFRSCSINYDRLVHIVSEGCPPCPADPCIPLAELRIADDEHCRVEDEIDITVRPIVFSNDMLFQLLLSLIREEPGKLYNK